MTSRVEKAGDGIDRQEVAHHAETGDRPRRNGGDDTGVAPWLTGVRLRNVYLDDRSGEGRQRIVKSPGVMGECTGIDDDRITSRTRVVNSVDQDTLVVRLERLEYESEASGTFGRRGDVIVQSRPTVDVGLTLTQEVQIWSVDQENVGHLPKLPSLASPTSAGYG